jgi:hypothetical protein
VTRPGSTRKRESTCPKTALDTTVTVVNVHQFDEPMQSAGILDDGAKTHLGDVLVEGVPVRSPCNGRFSASLGRL